MTHFKAGDVVRVPFPHVETNVRRYRPALVVTQEPVGPDGLLIWLAMITSAERKRWAGDVVIEDHRGAGLPIPSMIRTAKLATLESASAESLGAVTAVEIETVRRQLATHLGIV